MHSALATLPEWSLSYMGKGKPGRGLIHGLPEEKYHGTKALISKSSLDEFGQKSPLHYLGHLTASMTDERKAELRVGSAYHIATLEPDLMSQKVCILPYFGPLQSAKNREDREQWLRYNLKGRIWLTEREFAKVIAMRDVLLKSKLGKQLLGRGFSPEVTALWTCPETGLRCKARADALHADNGIFVDMKSALSASREAFRRAAAAHRYHVQDAFYSRAFEENDIFIEHFIFLVQEKEPPYAYAAYQLNDTARERGEALYMRELRQLRTCIDQDYFPSYTDNDAQVEGVMALDLPPYALKDWEVAA